MKSLTRPSVIAASVVIAGVVLAVVMGVLQGLGPAVLVLASLALLGVIALLSASVRSLSGDTPLTLDEAVGLGAPSAEEEQKRAVLRALKDLEYERSVGKISEEDYREFSARYREEARRLITKVDETLAASHALAERLLAERVASAGLSDAAPQSAASTAAAADAASSRGLAPDEAGGPADEGEDEEEDGDAAKEGAAESPSSQRALEQRAKPTLTCAACNTVNDGDARFCKSCGRSLRASDGELAAADKSRSSVEETSS